MNVKLRISLFILFLIVLNIWMFFGIAPAVQYDISSHTDNGVEFSVLILLTPILGYRSIRSKGRVIKF